MSKKSKSNDSPGFSVSFTEPSAESSATDTPQSTHRLPGVNSVTCTEELVRDRSNVTGIAFAYSGAANAVVATIALKSARMFFPRFRSRSHHGYYFGRIRCTVRACPGNHLRFMQLP